MHSTWAKRAIAQTDTKHKRVKKENVKNKELWLELHKLNNSLKIKWIWVKAHAGDPLNEEVDMLAKKAAESN